MLVPKTARKAVPDARKQGGTMADTGKSNGHLGIHHPFGARHGTPVAGQRPPLAASHESLAEQIYPKDWRAAPATLPVAADAPLEERLYPDSIHYVVARHSRGNHSDLHPYVPEPNATIPYYRVVNDAITVKNIVVGTLHNAAECFLLKIIKGILAAAQISPNIEI